MKKKHDFWHWDNERGEIIMPANERRPRVLVETPHPRILLIGEAPGPSSPRWSVFAGASGRRLDSLLGRPWREVMVGANLLSEHQDGPRFPTREARAAARQMALSSPWFKSGRTILLAGTRVASAFDLNGGAGYFKRSLILWRDQDGRERSAECFVVPHPSGRCRWWNDPANVRKARRWFQNLLKQK